MTPGLKRPVLWADRYVHVLPMSSGVRMAGGTEFSGLHAPPDFRRVLRLAQHAKELLPSLDPSPTSDWLGFRPSLPDSLHVIGKAPCNENVILCCGHQHLGVTLAPILGK